MTAPLDPWDTSIFAIPAEFRNYRYLFSDGNVMDVSSPYRSDSNDRDKVLAEANRRWGTIPDKGGKPNMYGRKIEGVSLLPNVEEVPDASA